MKPGRPKRTSQRKSGRAAAPRLSDQSFSELCEIIGHKFRDRSLLTRAVTHPSALPAGDPGLTSNQRLEFLGDRVLGLIVAERLFKRRRQEREGGLAPRLNRLVSKSACAAAARHVGLGDHVLMSPHEIAQGGRERDTTLGDVCESVIAALYLDSGLKRAQAFVEKAFAPQLNAPQVRLKDPKSALQEWAHASGLPSPAYRTLERRGPDHSPSFTVEVSVGEALREEARDKSKQNAERAAAQRLLEAIDPVHDAS